MLLRLLMFNTSYKLPGKLLSLRPPYRYNNPLFRMVHKVRGLRQHMLKNIYIELFIVLSNEK